MKKGLNKKKGFTLIELIVVVAIIGILVMLAVPRFTSMTQGANQRLFESNHRMYISAISMYTAAHAGALPAAKTDLADYMQKVDLNGTPSGATYTISAASGTDFLTSAWTDSTLPGDLVYNP